MPDAYRAFWDEVGERFPDLGGAASTACYRAAEERLFGEMLPDLADRRLLKTDLWDEAKNTRILGWASAQGAIAFGIDIAHPIALRAHRMTASTPIHAVVADVRELPFRSGSIDAIYSMGTIEHFADPERAVREMYRVLRPGGAAIVGVPNRFDPFLRPLLVLGLRALGLYAYGRERSYSRRGLDRLLETEGFRVEKGSGILFVPGWLRMLDLAAHVWWPPLEAATGPAVRCFAWLERRFRALRRHGYLIASLGRKAG